MRRVAFLWSSVLSFLFAASVIPVAGQAQTCGPICSQPGRYVLCNDSFDSAPVVAGSVEFTDFTHRTCASFAAPEPTYSMVGLYALLTAGGGTSAPCVWALEELGTDAPGPGLVSLLNSPCFQAPFSATIGWVSFDLTNTTAYQNLSVPIRVCIWDQLAMEFLPNERQVTYDNDGASGQNTVYRTSWSAASTQGVTGDFMIRPIVALADLTPWQAGGACNSGGADAGVSDAGSVDAESDAGPPQSDAEPADAVDGTVPNDDVGVAEDGGSSEDAAVAPDAGTPDPDAGSVGADAAAGQDATGLDVGGSVGDAGLPGEAPTIASITPNEGLNDRETDVLVTGTGFASGATLRIGQIPAVSVSVPGTTTLLAKVPPGIAPSVYDVTVQNPDQQAAVLPQGFTVIDASGTGNLPEDDCGCQAADSPPPKGGLLGILLLGLGLLLRSRSARPAPVRVRLARRRKTS